MARKTVNGDDVLEVREVVRRAIRRAREESLPTLVEAKTYRFRGHSISDPAKYRSKEELEFWKQRDPISTLGSRILGLGMATDAILKDIDTEVRREVEEAVTFAKESPAPSPSTLFDYVYAEDGGGEP
jgi:pyruvate dehydrogenase E1 component alpha subunit